MSDLSIKIHWQRAAPVFATGTYSNSHIVQMNQLHEIDVDSAPDWGGDPAHANPEQALASTLSGCQMSVTRVNLNPISHFDTGFAAADEKLAKMQDPFSLFYKYTENKTIMQS